MDFTLLIIGLVILILGAESIIRGSVSLAKKLNNAKIVTIFADGGWKYLSSGIYEKQFSEISNQINGKTWW